MNINPFGRWAENINAAGERVTNVLEPVGRDEAGGFDPQGGQSGSSGIGMGWT